MIIAKTLTMTGLCTLFDSNSQPQVSFAQCMNDHFKNINNNGLQYNLLDATYEIGLMFVVAREYPELSETTTQTATVLGLTVGFIAFDILGEVALNTVDYVMNTAGEIVTSVYNNLMHD